MTDSEPLCLVLDQGVPQDAAVRLREFGFQCMHVGEIGMWNAADNEILAWARKNDAVVVTLDADFHAILAVSTARRPSVIRLRLQRLGSSAVVRLVQQVIVEFGDDLRRGSLVTVKSNKTTCHRLPIGGSE